MKRFLLLVLLLLAGRVCLLYAADSFSDVAAGAAQRDAEERYKRLAADVQTVLDTQEVLLRRLDESRQRMDKLAEEIRTLKEDQNRASGNFVSRDEFRKYVEKLKELDEKREADKKLILDNIKALEKLPMAAPPTEKTPPKRVSESTEEGYYLYVIKKNDRLLDIVAACNEEFQSSGKPKITVDQVLKANPGLNKDHLVAGKKLRIPAPSKDAK